MFIPTFFIYQIPARSAKHKDELLTTLQFVFPFLKLCLIFKLFYFYIFNFFPHWKKSAFKKVSFNKPSHVLIPKVMLEFVYALNKLCMNTLKISKLTLLGLCRHYFQKCKFYLMATGIIAIKNIYRQINYGKVHEWLSGKSVLEHCLWYQF